MYNNIKVKVKSKYIPNQSNPIKCHYLFSYKVKIINNNNFSIKLLSRHWNIKDAQGGVEDIYGPGVVGKQPIIEPGKDFEYRSFCPLKTPIGFMKGEFCMIDDKKKEFDIEIKTFKLSVPEISN